MEFATRITLSNDKYSIVIEEICAIWKKNRKKHAQPTSNIYIKRTYYSVRLKTLWNSVSVIVLTSNGLLNRKER